MIKKTITLALITAISGGVITQANAETKKIQAIEKTEIEFNTSDKFLKDTIALIEAKEIERKRIEEEKRLKEIEEMRLKEERLIAENKRKSSVQFNALDTTDISNVTAVELYNILEHYKGGALSDFAWAIVDCEEIFNINAFFLTALIAHESSWGTSNRAKTQNNLTGHAVYNDAAKGSSFRSAEESIYSTARLLYNDYLTEGGKRYHGVSVKNINTEYCLTQDSSASDYRWSESIISIAKSFEETYHNKIK